MSRLIIPNTLSISITLKKCHIHHECCCSMLTKSKNITNVHKTNFCPSIYENRREGFDQKYYYCFTLSGQKCRAHFSSYFYTFSFVTFYLLFAFIFLRRKLDLQGRLSQVNWIPHSVEQNFFCSAGIIVNRNSSQRFLTAPNQSHTGHEQYHMNYAIGKFLSSVVSIYCCI